MQKLACYMCEEKTAQGITIAVTTTTPETKTLLSNYVPLCDRCITAVKLGSLYLELHRLIESDKARYTH